MLRKSKSQKATGTPGTCYFSFPYGKRDNHIKGPESHAIHVSDWDVSLFRDLKEAKGQVTSIRTADPNEHCATPL